MSNSTGPTRPLAAFDVNRDRSRDKPVEHELDELSPTYWIDRAVGRRYVGCTLDGFACDDDHAEVQSKVVQAVREYVIGFRDNFRDGRGLVLIGPKGTGKDHLMIAAIRAIANGFSSRSITYRSGEAFFDEFKERIGTGKSYSQLVERFSLPPLLAISDPLPVKGDLSAHDQEVLFRVLLNRYKEMRPTMATVNVANRDELEKRMGPQSADRLLDGALILKCNWPSYRQRKS